jgi:hypothetical protein
MPRVYCACERPSSRTQNVPRPACWPMPRRRGAHPSGRENDLRISPGRTRFSFRREFPYSRLPRLGVRLRPRRRRASRSLLRCAGPSAFVCRYSSTCLHEAFEPPFAPRSYLLNRQALSSFQIPPAYSIWNELSRRRLREGRTSMAKKAKKRATKTTAKKRWSKKVTETSDAMTLENGVFKKTPRAIALSLKRSSDRSTRRKSPPFRSAMSMLTFYENRAGKNLSATRKAKIGKAKEELRALYRKD